MQTAADAVFQTDMHALCKGTHTVDVVMPEPCGVAVTCNGGELNYVTCREVRAYFRIEPQIVSDGNQAPFLQLDVQLVSAFPLLAQNANYTCARPESLAALTNCKEFKDALMMAACRWEAASAALPGACLSQ